MKAAIVDDEPRSIEMLEWLLSAYCPGVAVAARFHTPEAALEAIPSLDFDVLFCDIAMPRINGFDLVRALPEGRFSVVFVTAHNGPVQRALRKNGIDFLLKPVDDEELARLVRRLEHERPIISREQLAAMSSVMSV